MSQKFPPVKPNFPHLLHGGDYNPEQWLEYPHVLEEDIRLMQEANCNVVSIGIFSWSMLEPREGQFEFGWMDDVIDRLAKGGINFVLATPTGAKPNWMAIKYPEIRRVNDKRQRDPQQGRHNHCYTSPVYREKATIINTKLAERYGKHPSLVMWHLSNEYGGECHCDLCKNAFRQWLQKKFKTIDALNHAYWARFWSHTFADWSEIDAIDNTVHGLALDWKRFVTDQTVDFMLHEMKPLRQITPDVPCTTNMMGFYPGLNYWKFAPHLDVISWDSYPFWHTDETEWKSAVGPAMAHDLNRSMKHKPFILMESTPSQINWTSVSPLKRPGMHVLSGMQAIAHGADSVMYFQWRKSRGSFEKFHGAVVDHVGNEHTRVFQDVKRLGAEMKKLPGVVGSSTPTEAAVIFDWENRWMIDMEAGPRNSNKDYHETVLAHYEQLWRRGVPCDVNDAEQDLSRYKLVIAPMLYMIRPGVAERIEKYVENGGTLVTTYFTGYVDENDLCFLTGFPGPLRELIGIWAEELDALSDSKRQTIIASDKSGIGLSGSYEARHFCELIHTEGAEVLATYGSDFYTDRPAVTMNRFGKGRAYHVASRNDERFLSDFLGGVLRHAGVRPAVDAELPVGVTATVRSDGESRKTFFMNFNGQPTRVGHDIELPAYGWKIVEQKI